MYQHLHYLVPTDSCSCTRKAKTDVSTHLHILLYLSKISRSGNKSG